MVALSWFLQLLSVCIVLSVDTCNGAVPPCYDNWFGSPCRYKCHCASGGTCNKTTGECMEPTSCEKGWFGPSCQYVDLVITNTSLTPAWVYDSPDILCNPGQDTVTITLTNEFYFTWLRLRTNVTVSSQNFKLQLVSGDGSAVECSNSPIYIFNDKIVDIHCQTGVFFQQLTITGEGVKYLCSVQISGGRNAALGQNTKQFSVYMSSDSWLAVDGNTDPNWDHGSCTSTVWDDNKPSWTLTFEQPHHINRYVLYNRDRLQERLRGFTLTADEENKHGAFTYTDLSNTNHDIYIILSNTTQVPVSNVTVVATYLENGRSVLSLCEMEMFGDTACPTGLWGRECENKCNCAMDGESCFVSTGGCPSGCAAGYQGEECHNICNATSYGEDCAFACSSNCTDQHCNATNGNCLSCVTGKSGVFCSEACPSTTFGDNCRETCSTNCSSQLCDPVTGKCASCVQGSAGDYCDHTLPANERDESPPVGAIVGPVVAVVVLTALIVGGVFIWRRRQHPTTNNGQTSQLRFQNVGVTESLGSEKICAETPEPLKTDSGQANLAEINQHRVDGGYCNCVPSLTETSDTLSGKETSTIENRTEDQQQVTIVVASNSGASVAAESSDHQYDRHTNSIDDNPYEIPIASTKVTQKSRQLKSEEGLACTKELTANIYENIDDTIPNPYQDINYIQSI